MARRLRANVLAIAALILSLGSGATWLWSTWSYDRELSRAERDVAERRFAEARERLIPLARLHPGRDEIEYPLGISEAQLGHVDSALAAWARIPPDSVIHPRAHLERAKLALARGRLAAAEESLALIENAPGDLGEQAAGLALQLDLFSGRAYRIPRRIERRRGATSSQAARLRTHWLYETQAFPAKEVADALDRMSLEAPEDDRVRLGRADLAARAGRFDEADALLADCERRRPDDPDVRHARLIWALDAGRLDAAERAIERLPASRYSAAEISTIAARVAELRGDAPARIAALKRRVEAEPGDSSAWGALAGLVARGPFADPALLERARSRKAEIDLDSDRYRNLMGQFAGGDASKAAELARVAESLGRRFEALGWWRIRASQAPGDDEARAAGRRLEARSESVPDRETARSLAELLPKTAAKSSPIAVSGKSGAIDLPEFRDRAEASGLRFIYRNDPTPLRRLPETMGGGLGLIDYDGDGFLDVYVVQGGRLSREAGPTKPSDPEELGDRLFRNKRDGNFEDVTERSGLSRFPQGYGHGVAVGDFDGDGAPDLFVTRWRSFALYRNKGDGTFEDVTDARGLGGDRGWPTSAAFADLDADGDLDLYVCRYLKWDPDRASPCPDPDRPGRHLYCVPRAFEAEPDRLFRNDGGKFSDVTDSAGIVDSDGRGLGVVICDLDGDGRPDIYIANDMTANFLFRNLGGMKFEEVAAASGAASNGGGGFQAGMGVACGDLDRDGRPDLVVTNFYGESATLFAGLGDGLFLDKTASSGLAAPTRFLLGFGAAFFDADNDGRSDLAVANGHVNDYRPAIPHAMPAQLFLGDGSGRLNDVSANVGACWSEPRVGRGLAVGDLDNDGRQDVLVLSQGSPLAYFHNEGPTSRFLTLKLRGVDSNRDGSGSVVKLTFEGETRTAWRLGGGSFLSASDPRLHFGLGRGPVEGTPGATVEVRRPNGRVDRYEGLRPNSGYELVEGDPVPRPLKGFS